MKNWAENIDVNSRRQIIPSNMLELANAVRAATKANRQIRAFGSAWSFTDCWATPDFLIDTSRLNKIFAFSQGREVWGHTDPGKTTDPGDESVVLIEAIRDEVLATGRRLAHIAAGIKLKDLIEALDHPTSRENYRGRDISTRDGQPMRGRWTLNTMGGATGQSLAGALSTATHGGDFNLSPMADMVRAIHLIAPDGTPHWIERSGNNSITSRDKFAAMNRLAGALTGLLPENIHYDDDLFNAALVSLGRMGIICAYVIEARSQYGLSERVAPRTTWRAIRDHLRSGAIFTGTTGIDWLSTHPNNLASSSSPSVDRRARGLSIFINPYRIGDNYETDTQPDRNVLLVTHAEAIERFDDRRHSRPAGPDLLKQAELIKRFEHADNLRAVRQVLDEVITILRPSSGTNGFPIAHSVLTSTGDQQPVLSMEIVVSTFGGRHVDFIDRLLAIFDSNILRYWGPSSGSGQRPKFAGGINLRYTRPTSALVGMQRDTAAARDERFCHIEIILLKETSLLGTVPNHHDMESFTEDWVKQIERAAIDFGARLHWGQLHQLTRRQVERSYPDTLHRWRQAATKFLSKGDSSIFSNRFTKRSGLEPNSEVLAATSWGANRYDIFRYNDRGEVLQMFWGPGWRWANLGNRFSNNERFIGPLTATSWGHNRIDVFGLGQRGTIMQLWWQGGWNWSDLSQIYPTIFREDIRLLGPLAATSPAAGRIELFGIAERGEVWRFWFDREGWHSQNLGNRFPAGERFFGTITAAAWGSDRIDVFGLGSRGQVLQLWRQGDERAGWNWSDLSRAFPPEQLKIAGPLTAVSTGASRIDILCTNENGHLLRLFWDSAWSWEAVQSTFPSRVTKMGWAHEFGSTPGLDDLYKFDQRRCLPTQFVGPISVATWGGRRLDVFGLGDNGNVLQMWRDHDRAGWNWSDLDNGWVRNRNLSVESLIVDIRIGRDGIDRDSFTHRGPSQAEGVVVLSGGRTIEENLSKNEEWQPLSLNSRTISLPAGTRLGDIQEFGLRSLTAGGNFNADNWDVEELTVIFVSPQGSGTLLHQCGSPLVRFTKNGTREWKVSIRLP